MRARTSLLLIGSMLAAVGCLSDDKKLTTVAPSPFAKTSGTQAASFKQAPPATQEIALRVDRVGKQLVNANPRINQKITFLTLGAPHEEIFHQSQKDVGAIIITEGLAKQCKTDSELAAVLSEELGKLVSEQLAKAKPVRKPVPSYLTNTPRIGNDMGGAIGSADRTDEMIAAHFEKEFQESRPTLPAPPPPPETLARTFLSSAGFDPKELETVAPLLRKAEANSSLEQTMNGKQGS